MNNYYLQWFHVDIIPNPINQKWLYHILKHQLKLNPYLWNYSIVLLPIADLNEKGEIELNRYKKYLFNCD